MTKSSLSIKIILSLSVLILVSSCKKLEEEELIIKNPANVKQNDAPVIVKRKQIEEKFGPVPLEQTILLLDEKGDTIPSQLDDIDNDGKWDELSFVKDFPPNSQDTVLMELIDTADAPDFKNRTNIRFVTLENPEKEIQEAERLDYEQTGENEDVYQMEGPAWENDRVGFRNYFDPRSGMDIFGKTAEEMALDGAGIRGQNYHELDNWGMDILKVGRSLGAGSIGLKVKDSLVRIGPDSEGGFKRIFEGPVRSRLRFTYDEMEISGNTYQVIHDITIWPGEYGYKGKVTVNGLKGDEQLIVGMVNKGVDSLTVYEPNNQYISLITHDKQAIENEYLGMGLLLEQSDFVASGKAPISSQKATGIVDTYYALMDLSNQPVSYKFYAGWELSDPKFSEREGFIDYVRHEATKNASAVNIVK
jgi:hypothetical protein